MDSEEEKLASRGSYKKSDEKKKRKRGSSVGKAFFKLVES